MELKNRQKKKGLRGFLRTLKGPVNTTSQFDHCVRREHGVMYGNDNLGFSIGVML